jgi:hypothetical protein
VLAEKVVVDKLDEVYIVEEKEVVERAEVL